MLKKHQTPTSREAANSRAAFGIWDFCADLKTHGMPCFEAAWRTIGGLPARRPVPGIIVVWRGIESQPGDNGKSMAVACVNGDPFATAALPVPAKFSRAHRRIDHTRCAQHIRDSAGTIVAAIVKRLVTSTVPVRLRAKLICRPDCSLHWHRRFLGRSRLPRGVNTRLFASNNRPREGKKVGDC